ncbi:hypothetical protein NAP1_15543 [Erythrobacter sp. NAP1]|nr:hypothetical protein NAP1_15543 [Erythrobacter sp. NAP1]
MEASLEQVDFAKALLFTHCERASLGTNPDTRIEFVAIEPIVSSEAYSRFILDDLAQHIETDHCLIVQWDGHVIDARQWHDEFLEYDYIGASWPQFDDGHDVGNGGFSLRSKGLMQACSSSEFQPHHPEDIAICRTNRPLLEAQGFRFASAEIADRFAAERAGEPESSFGYHGIFLMPRALGTEAFWTVYETLDDRSTLRHDFWSILAQVMLGRRGLRRGFMLLVNRLRGYSRKSKR